MTMLSRDLQPPRPSNAQALAAAEYAEDDDIDVLWLRVDDIWKDGIACQDCPYMTKRREGYGEALRHCSLIDRIQRLHPSECWGLQT